MRVKQNFHTHTRYCDGKNTPEEMVQAALDRGMTAIGFSGHTHTAFDESYAMSHEAAQAYFRELRRLQAAYAGQIEIYAGLEYDFYSDEDPAGWPEPEQPDYRIGSVHYICLDGEYIPVDESAAQLREAIDRLYGGDPYALAEAYFTTEAQVAEQTRCDIIGHFDLLTKFIEQPDGALWDLRHPRYVAAYTRAIQVLAPTGLPFEINTGAMSRGYRKAPYPSRDILECLYREGGRIAFSTDAHEADTIDYGLDQAADLARAVGFRRYTVIGPDGPYELPL